MDGIRLTIYSDHLLLIYHESMHYLWKLGVRIERAKNSFFVLYLWNLPGFKRTCQLFSGEIIITLNLAISRNRVVPQEKICYANFIGDRALDREAGGDSSVFHVQSLFRLI